VNAVLTAPATKLRGGNPKPICSVGKNIFATKVTKVIAACRENNNVINLVLTALRGLCGYYFFSLRRCVFNEAKPIQNPNDQISKHNSGRARAVLNFEALNLDIVSDFGIRASDLK